MTINTKSKKEQHIEKVLDAAAVNVGESAAMSPLSTHECIITATLCNISLAPIPQTRGNGMVHTV